MDTVIQAVSHIHWTQQKSRNPADKHNDLLHERWGRRYFRELYFRRGRGEVWKSKKEMQQTFIIKRNVILEPAKFNMKKQEPGGLVDTYITDFYCLSEHCEFGAPRGELIWDRIMVGLL